MNSLFSLLLFEYWIFPIWKSVYLPVFFHTGISTEVMSAVESFLRV